jgi:hypothetical protein
VLKTALATAQKFTRKRPFPFHDPGTTQPDFPDWPARNSQNLCQPARATNGKTAALPEPLCRQRLRQPCRAGAMQKRPFSLPKPLPHKRPFPTNAPQFPKTYPINLRRNRQNRCRCQPACLKRLRQPCRATANQKRPFSLPKPLPRQTAVPNQRAPVPQNLPNQPAAQPPKPLPLPTRLPKTSAPTLPGNGQTKPAFAYQNLRRSANADQPTGLNFPPPCQSSDQAQNDPNLVAEPRWRLLSKADALPKRSTESGLLLPKPFAVCQSLKGLSPREPTRILEKNQDQNLKKSPQ